MNPPHKTSVSSSSSSWFSQNVYPLVTPKGIICFTLSQISFFLAYGFFTQTELYKSYIQDHSSSAFDKARPLIFLAAAFGIHTIILVFLMLFSFCSMALERNRYHYILKSIGEYLVMLMVHHLVGGVVVTHDISSKVAGFVTCVLLTIDALCIVNLLEPGHHYALLEASSTLTLHLGLAEKRMYLYIPAASFVFAIVMIKNFLWRKHVSHGQNPNSQVHHVAMQVVAPES